MAREHRFDLILNARVNGNSALTKAQAEFNRLGTEVKNLSRIQSDVSAYQKQQQSMERTTAKLQNLRAQEEQLQKQLDATKNAENQDAAAIAALEREKLKLEERIRTTVNALEDQQKKLQATGDRLKEAGVDTSTLSQKSAELTSKLGELTEQQKSVETQLKQLTEQQNNAADSAENFGNQAAQGMLAVGQAIAAAGIANALKEVANAYAECIRIAGDFEASMSNVEALSGATAQQMGELTAKAKEMGATTKFTAQEAGDAMGYMAMAGWDAVDMLNGLNGVMQLAAASGEDLAMVSDIVTDSLSAFGLTAADTAHFSDVLAAAATNSNTNVAIMGETFKMSASVAGALGYSIEDVATAVGLMANSGVKGSIAGTALRNTFNGLLEGATLTADAIGEYEFSAVKADGTMKSFSESMGELRRVFDQMTEAERVNNAQVVAGLRGYNGLLAILNATDADYQSLSDSINDCTGAAQRMAQIKLDNLNGDLTIMKSAWDALKTSIGEELIPVLRQLAQVGTAVFSGLNGFVQEHPAMVKAITAFTAVMGAATVGVTAFGAAVKVVRALDLAALFTGPAAPVLMLAGGLATAAAAFAAFTEEVDTVTYASQEQKTKLDSLNAEYERAVSVYGETSEEASRLRYELNELNTEYENSVHTAKELAQQHDDLIAAVSDSAAAYKNAADESRSGALDAAALATKLKDLASAGNQSEGELEMMGGMIDQLNGQFEGLNLTLEDVTSGGTGWESMLDNFIRKQTEAAEKADALARGMELIKEKTKLEDDRSAYEKEIAALEEEKKRLEQIQSTDPSFILTSYAVELDEVNAKLAEHKGNLEETNDAIAANEEEYQRMVDTLGGVDGAIEDVISQQTTLTGVIDAAGEMAAALTKAYEDSYNAALESIQGQFELWDVVPKVVAESVEEQKKAQASQRDYWAEYNQNLDYLLQKTAEIEGLREYINALNDGSEKSASNIAGLTNELKNGNIGAVKETIAVWKDAQIEQEKAAEKTAEFQTGYSTAMEQIKTDTEDAIKGMNLSEEAAKSAQQTMDGYIRGLNQKLPAVQEVLDSYSRAIRFALAGSVPKISVSGTTDASDTSRHPNGRKGLATGTQNAAPGLTLVGEEGPELVYFHGGEKVLTATQTAALRDSVDIQNRASEISDLLQIQEIYSRMERAAAFPAVQTVSENSVLPSVQDAAPTPVVLPDTAGNNTLPPIQINIQVSGNATPETVTALRDTSADIADVVASRVMDMLENQQTDRTRLVYR